MNRSAPQFDCFVCALIIVVTFTVGGPLSASTTLERELEIELAVDGKQSWRNGAQWSKGSTSQHYEMVTRLRSDGQLQGANLLDLDLDRRMAIKLEYMRRKGLEQARRGGGGQLRLPQTDEERQQVSERSQLEMYNCKGDPDCMSLVVQRYSAVLATASSPDGTPPGSQVGGALLDQPGRFLFFFGYDGCPNRIHATFRMSIEGQEAFDRAHRNLVPFSLQRQGDSPGDEADRNSLCRRYTAVVDTQERRLYLDNVYLPSSRGVTERTVHGSARQLEEELVPLEEAQQWSSRTLRQAAESGSASATLQLTSPLDGNATVGGAFEGVGEVTLKWSFLPIAAQTSRLPP